MSLACACDTNCLAAVSRFRDDEKNNGMLLRKTSGGATFSFRPLHGIGSHDGSCHPDPKCYILQMLHYPERSFNPYLESHVLILRK